MTAITIKNRRLEGRSQQGATWTSYDRYDPWVNTALVRAIHARAKGALNDMPTKANQSEVYRVKKAQWKNEGDAETDNTER
jgi:hypothetical protein